MGLLDKCFIQNLALPELVFARNLDISKGLVLGELDTVSCTQNKEFEEETRGSTAGALQQPCQHKIPST